MLDKLFKQYNEEVIQKFEIIFDNAISEKIAKEQSINYYNSLLDEDVEVDIDEIVSLAECYGYDFDDFKKLVENN